MDEVAVEVADPRRVEAKRLSTPLMMSNIVEPESELSDESCLCPPAAIGSLSGVRDVETGGRLGERTRGSGGRLGERRGRCCRLERKWREGGGSEELAIVLLLR